MPNDRKERRINAAPDQGESDLIAIAPRLDPMPAGHNEPPESAIGGRIEYARKALKLSVEALARYTSFFDHSEYPRAIPSTPRKSLSESTSLGRWPTVHRSAPWVLEKKRAEPSRSPSSRLQAPHPHRRERHSALGHSDQGQPQGCHPVAAFGPDESPDRGQTGAS